jgi:hypothetical protein
VGDTDGGDVPDDDGLDVTAERIAEVAELLGSFVPAVAGLPGVLAVGLCGSWATGDPTMGSDVDLIVLTDERAALSRSSAWAGQAVGEGATLVRQRDWGPMLTELRLRRASGLEIEIGLADRAWAGTDPVDTGSARVVNDGCIVLYDPHRLLATLVEAARP